VFFLRLSGDEVSSSSLLAAAKAKRLVMRGIAFPVNRATFLVLFR
jgi:hypothetical protein